MGANGYGGKAPGQGKRTESSGRTGAKDTWVRSGGSDRLDAVRLRASLGDRTQEEPLRMWLGVPEEAG